MTVVLTIARLLLRLWQLLLVLQFIFMFLPVEWENGTMSVLRAITEPLLAPIRALLEKAGLSRELQHVISPIVLLLIYEALILLLR